MAWLISIAKRFVFLFRLRKAFKRLYPELNDAVIRQETDAIVDMFFNEKDISRKYAEYAVRESVSYWGV
jgi:hypothetical protein